MAEQRATRIPAIPNVPRGLNPETARFLAAIKEASEVITGKRGDKTDRAITYREVLALIASEVAKATKTTSSTSSTSTSSSTTVTTESILPLLEGQISESHLTEDLAAKLMVDVEDDTDLSQKILDLQEEQGLSYETMVTAEAIAINSIVVPNASGLAVKASAATIADAGNIVGVTLQAGAGAGAEVDVCFGGTIVNDSWSWTVPGLIFAGTNGALTQTIPTGSNSAFSQIIGKAIAPTKMIVGMQPPIILLAAVVPTTNSVRVTTDGNIRVTTAGDIRIIPATRTRITSSGDIRVTTSGDIRIAA